VERERGLAVPERPADCQDAEPDAGQQEGEAHHDGEERHSDPEEDAEIKYDGKSLGADRGRDRSGEARADQKLEEAEFSYRRALQIRCTTTASRRCRSRRH